MPISRPRWLSPSRVCPCTLLSAFLAGIAAFVFTVFYVALPMRRAYYLELDYQQKLIDSDSNSDSKNSQQQPFPHVRPLVQDIPQLFFWTIPNSRFNTCNDLLWLNHDGTGTDCGAGSDIWIYLAGTAQNSRRQQPDAYSHEWLKPDCTDPAYICDAYLDAFRRISRRWSNLPGPLLRWVDCDLSPMLCSPFWGLSGVNMLVHMQITPDCDYSMLPAGSCPVKWRWIGLPIYQAPWTRQIRIPLDRGGSTIVPAFPSPEEQLWNVMAYPGAIDALDYADEKTNPPGWNSMASVTPQHKEPPKTDVWHAPFSPWGLFRDMVDNPWDAPEWPYETEIKCYIERYADILLAWWDDTGARLVQPRSCVDIAHKTKQGRKEEEETWDEFRTRADEKRRKEWDRLMDEVFDDLRKYEARN
jgi:hypothetical protein